MTVETLFEKMTAAFPTMAQNGKIFFDHVTVEEGEEILPPYMVISETQKDPFFADNVAYYLTVEHEIDVYTAQYDVNLINRVAELLTENEIAFSLVSSSWLDDVGAYMTTFSVDLDESGGES